MSTSQLTVESECWAEYRTTDNIELLNKAYAECICTERSSILLRSTILKRMEDLVGLEGLPRSSDVRYLLRIADGTLDADLYWVIRDALFLLKAVEHCRLDIQKRIAANKPFELMTLSGDTVSVPALDMSTLHIRQLFKKGEVRTLTEQAEWLREWENRERVKKLASEPGPNYLLNPKRGGIVVNGPCFIPKEDILHLAKKLIRKRVAKESA